MKKRLFLLYIFFLSHFFLFGQNISDSVYKSLKSNRLSPKTQSLIVSGQNDFAYNIMLEKKSSLENSKKLVLLFFQEDFQKNESLINTILNFLFHNPNPDETFDFDLYVLFTYGDNQKVEKHGMVYGNQTFIESINTNEDYTVIIFDLDSDLNTILTSSKGYTTPSWLIKNEYNALLHSQLPENLPLLYLSQLFHFNFFYDRLLSDFFNADIPAVKVCIKENSQDFEKIADLITHSVYLYSKTELREWDHHFLMIKFFGRYINLTEAATLKIIIVIILSWLIFIFTFIFINNSMKKFAWQRVKKILYVAPLSFVISLLAQYIGRFLFLSFKSPETYAGQIYMLISIQFVTSIVLLSLFYLFVLTSNQAYEARSVDYLILLSSFINQSFFILLDISLFPIFMILCLLSLLSVITKNNKLHIIIFILMILPYIPYIHYVITYSELSELSSYLINNKILPLTFSLILNPLMLLYFRVLSFIKIYSKKFSHQLIGVCSAVLSIVLLVLIISLIRVPQLNKIQSQKLKLSFEKSSEDLISFSYKDRDIFEETIRTINIEIDQQPVQCDIRINCQNGNPILYTDNAYEVISQNSVFFKIPSYPPQKMTFSYGCNKGPCLISITAIIKSDKENTYKLVSKSIPIGRIE